MKKFYCIDKERDGLWRIYAQYSSIPHGCFQNLEDAVKHIEGHMEILKVDYQINPTLTFPETFQEFVNIIQGT